MKTQEKAGHTKGPWFEVQLRDGFDKCNSYKIIAGSNRMPAPIVCELRDVDNLTNEANARLIAAAPELLEAAKAMRDQRNREEKVEAWEKLLAAIDRAEGSND